MMFWTCYVVILKLENYLAQTKAQYTIDGTTIHYRFITLYIKSDVFYNKKKHKFKLFKF